ncbi:hypothetical protein SFRURICE_020366, partial [Spodoptera frugiperda]
RCSTCPPLFRTHTRILCRRPLFTTTVVKTLLISLAASIIFCLNTLIFCIGFVNPNRRIPDISVFDGVYRRLRETGSVSRRRSDLGRPRINDDDDEEQDNAIVRRFRQDPTTSTNIVARELGVSQWKVWFTLHTAGLYPYHYTPVHVIEEGDPVRRLDFCRFMLNADLEDPSFLRSILWTDESKFDQDGYFINVLAKNSNIPYHVIPYQKAEEL